MRANLSPAPSRAPWRGTTPSLYRQLPDLRRSGGHQCLRPGRADGQPQREAAAPLVLYRRRSRRSLREAGRHGDFQPGEPFAGAGCRRLGLGPEPLHPGAAGRSPWPPPAGTGGPSMKRSSTPSSRAPGTAARTAERPSTTGGGWTAASSTSSWVWPCPTASSAWPCSSRTPLSASPSIPSPARSWTRMARSAATAPAPLTPEEIVQMDWLCQGVEGSIPSFDQLLPMSRSMVRLLGLYRDAIPPETEGKLL